MPFHATGYALLRGVHGLGALGALGDISGDERHLETLKVLIWPTQNKVLTFD